MAPYWKTCWFSHSPRRPIRFSARTGPRPFAPAEGSATAQLSSSSTLSTTVGSSCALYELSTNVLQRNALLQHRSPARRQAEAALDVLVNAAELVERALHVVGLERAARDAQLATANRVARRVARNLSQPRVVATDVRDLALHDVKAGEHASRKPVADAEGSRLPHRLHLHEVEDGRLVHVAACGNRKELRARADRVPAGAHERA